jgi:hypothetical protein
MVYPVNSGTPSTPAAGGAGGNDVATSSQLEKCRRQLGDWVACPSGKTPEGKKIIENLRSQITRLEQRVQSQSGTQNTGATGVASQRLDVWA